MLTWQRAGVLFVIAIVSGAMNAVAGGGSFLTFPALLLAGVPPIQANATKGRTAGRGDAAGDSATDLSAFDSLPGAGK